MQQILLTPNCQAVLPKAVIVDLSVPNLNSDSWSLNLAVIEFVKNIHNAGYVILFISNYEMNNYSLIMQFVSRNIPEVCCEYFHSQLKTLVSQYKKLTPGSEDKIKLELEVKKITDELVKIHVEDPGSVLFMRSIDDDRNEILVKKEIYERQILGKYEVCMVLDENFSTHHMWKHDLGLSIFNL